MAHEIILQYVLQEVLGLQGLIKVDFQGYFKWGRPLI